MEERCRQAHIRQGKQHADLPVALAPGAGRISQDGDLDRAALWSGRDLEERPALASRMGRSALHPTRSASLRLVQRTVLFEGRTVLLIDDVRILARLAHVFFPLV